MTKEQLEVQVEQCGNIYTMIQIMRNNSFSFANLILALFMMQSITCHSQESKCETSIFYDDVYDKYDVFVDSAYVNKWNIHQVRDVVYRTFIKDCTGSMAVVIIDSSNNLIITGDLVGTGKVITRSVKHLDADGQKLEETDVEFYRPLKDGVWRLYDIKWNMLKCEVYKKDIKL